MEDKDKISLYCKSLAQHHSYLSRALREDGSLDLQDFLVRYQHVVDQLPSRPENKKRVSSAWDFSEKEKRALLLRAGLDGRYHTTNELVSELGLGEGSVVKTLKYAENVFGYGGRVIMDTLYLEEFDSLVRSGVEPANFDPSFLEKARERSEDETARRRLIRSRGSQKIEDSALPFDKKKILLEAGINTVGDLRNKPHKELYGIFGVRWPDQLSGFFYLAESPTDALEFMGLSARVAFVLRRKKINTTTQLMGMSDEELLERGITQTTLQEIRSKVAEYRESSGRIKSIFG